MQTKKYSPLVLALALTVGGNIAGAQTTATGQVVAPGTQPRKPAANPCNTTDTNAAVSSTNDANCLETSPGFAVPGVGKAAAERPRNVVAFVRVDTVIPRPPVAMPDGDSFSVVGSVVQLPGIGGGAQLLTITALTVLFGIPRELASSAGLILWVVSSMSVILPGVVFARIEQVSLRSVAQQSGQAEKLHEPHPVH